MTQRERALSRIKKVGECWLWVGSLKSTGHGQMDGKPATHIVWKLSGRTLRPGEQLNHKPICPNKNCVRPKHLYIGTPADNNRDTVLAGNSNKILLPHEVESIREEYNLREISQRKLSEKYGVSQMTVSRAIRRG